MALKYQDLPEFTQGFIEAAFFANQQPPQGGEFTMDPWLWEHHFTNTERREVQVYCHGFETSSLALLSIATSQDGYDLKQAGRDFYYVQAGHGVGFLDRKQLPAGLALNLTNAVRNHPNPIDLYYITECEQYAATGEACGDCGECESGDNTYEWVQV